MSSTLQDARAQPLGTLDLAIVHASGMPKGWEPQSDIRATDMDIPWSGGTDAEDIALGA